MTGVKFFLTNDKATEGSKSFKVKLKAVPDSTFHLPIACPCQTKHLYFTLVVFTKTRIYQSVTVYLKKTPAGSCLLFQRPSFVDNKE